MPKRLLARDDTVSLGVELNTNTASVNNVGKLLTVLKSSGSDVRATKNAIIALERWFSERLCLGDLRDSDATMDDAERTYTEWFDKHYKVFIKRLCVLVGGDGDRGDGKEKKDASNTNTQTDAKTRVLAFAAVMECARSEVPGRFNNELFGTVLGAAVTGGNFGEELLGALTKRYLVKTDVRYHCYAAVKRLAESSDLRVSTSGKETAATGSGGDLARNLYDVLSRTPAEFGDYKKKKPTRETKETSGTKAKPAADDADGEDFEAMLGVMKGTEQTFPDGEDGEDADADPFGGAWCKEQAVGERAASDTAALRASLQTGSRKKARQATAAVKADEARSLSNEVNDKWADGKKHRARFQETWLALLRKPFPNDVYRKVLLTCHKQIMPHLQNPSLLGDFFITSIDRGGLDGMLALNGMFTLMTRHDLEYPRFYDRLYVLLDQSSFHAQNRKGFFELLDIFLKSSALPAYLAASFIKRLARLSLTAPPAGAMVAVAFIHNLLRRHPGCSVLVHRGGDGGDGDSEVKREGVSGATTAASSDPFLENEQDPSKTNALQSTLWEIATLGEHHYYPQVGKMAKMIEEKDLSNRVKTAELPVGELVSVNYHNLLAEELGSRVKTAPVAFHQKTPTGLFQTATMKLCFPPETFKWSE